ncbi:hypothetical protein ACIBL5_30585 [Streptomyces sp. NPDC050516]|uniref:hypothetical protein n=1 Tax=Streptomyces sp. NPDC050516 TaxID=3365621 RepID=UPI0037A2587F
MQTISDRSAVGAPVAADLLPVLAGAALAVSAVGAALAFAGLDSPLRAPLALFYLVAAPAEAAVFALRRLEPLARMVASLSGAVLIDVLTAESMAGLHLWSTRNGITAVGVISLLLFLLGTGVNRSGCDRESPVKNTET